METGENPSNKLLNYITMDPYINIYKQLKDQNAK